MHPRRHTPTVRLRRLAGELRRMRAAVGLTREEVAARTGMNVATLYRVERARVRPQKRTLAALLDLYGAPPAVRAELLDLSRRSDELGWLQPHHSGIPEPYLAYISLEAEARSLRNCESLFIPGLLQTEDYARAVISGALPDAAPAQIDQAVQVRLQRQTVLTRADPVELWIVVDEAAFHRQVGGRVIMQQQIKQVAQCTERPNITLQVIPFALGAHAGMAGPFVIMDFPSQADTSVVYTEGLASELFLETESEVARYSVAYDNLRAAALSPAESANFIAALAEGP